MIKIIDIKRTKKTLTLIFSDNTTRTISHDTAREFFIYTGKDVSEADLQKITTYESETKHYQYALALLNRGSYTVLEIKNKLRKRIEDENVITAIIERLKTIGLLDDTRYAKERAAFLLHHKKASRRSIKNDLIKKGIHPFLIEETFATLPEIEVMQIKTLIPKLIKRYAKESLKMAEHKIMAKLMQDGFQTNAIKTALDDFTLSDFIHEDQNLQNFFHKTLRQRFKPGNDRRKVVYNKLSKAGYPHHKINQLLEEHLNEN